jgi:PST family polysaccharide transporter
LFIVRQLSGFRWSVPTKKVSLVFLALISAVFWAAYALPPLVGMLLGTLAAILSGVYSLRTLVDLVSSDRIPHRILKLLVWLRLTGSHPSEAQA